jgi:plastocyanin
VNHSLYSETQGAEFEILHRPGQSFTRRFSQPGVVVVRCAIHPHMKLKVQVRKKEP